MVGARVYLFVLALSLSWPWSKAAEPVVLEERTSARPEFLRESIRRNDAYFTNDQLAAYLKDYAQRCSHLSHLFSIGKTATGQRDLWVLEISNNPGVVEAKPYIKFVANMHGNEPTGRQILLQWAEWMCSAYQKDPTVTRMVNAFHVMLLPSMNPDGFDRRSRTNSENKDLNRNFPDPIQKMDWKGWANDLPPSGKESAETLAVMNWTTSYRFVASVSMHEGAVVVNYPWDGSLDKRTHYSASPDDKVFRHLALLYAKYNPGMRTSRYFQNGVTNGAQWYPLWGGMQDWNYIHAGCLELTLELSADKWPNTRELPRLWADNRQSLLAYANAASYGGVWGSVAAVDGKLLAANISVQGISKTMFSGPLGDFYRPLSPGTYTVTASATGYEAQSREVTVPNDNSGAKLQFALLPEIVAPHPEPRAAAIQQTVKLPRSAPIRPLPDPGLQHKLEALDQQVETRSENVSSNESAVDKTPRLLPRSISSVYLLLVAALFALIIMSWRRTRRQRNTRRRPGSSV